MLVSSYTDCDMRGLTRSKAIHPAIGEDKCISVTRFFAWRLKYLICMALITSHRGINKKDFSTAIFGFVVNPTRTGRALVLQDWWGGGGVNALRIQAAQAKKIK